MLLFVSVFFATESKADIPMNYYSSLDGKCGAELKTAIHNLISNNVSMLSYGSGSEHTWWGFYVTDCIDNGTSRQVVDRYSNDVRYFGSRGSSVSGMNIEHSFPKSWWGGSSNNAYKDLFNLMPSEQSINSAKSNYGMGVVTSTKTNNGCTKVGTGADGTSLWEPADKWKGEFARGYMYMATAYQDFTWESRGLDLLVQGDYPTLQQWAYTLYISWAKNDPVDQMEIDRNQAVSEIQGNRNPYVDFPNLMEYVWGDSINIPLNLETTLKAGATTDGDPIPTTEVIYSKNFVGNNGGCTASGTYAIWKVDEKYGWTATGYISGACTVSDASIETPELDLSGYDKAAMIFDHAANKFNNEDPETYCSVGISVDGASPEYLSDGISWPNGTNWTFIPSGTIDLSAYVGHKIKVVFRYTSNTATAGTWEIKTLKVTASKLSGVDCLVDDVDESAPLEYYSIDGRRLDKDTARGLVIVRQGSRVSKTFIR